MCGFFANDEIHNHHPEYLGVEAFGKNDCNTQDDYIKNFVDAITDFTTQFPSAHVGPYTIDKEKNEIRYFRWYMMNGLASTNGGSNAHGINHPHPNPSLGVSNFALANGEFLKWLYMDDGAGNIINNDGMGMRDDIIRNWTANGFEIPPTTEGFK